MRTLLFIIVISFILTSCSLLSGDPTERISIPAVGNQDSLVETEWKLLQLLEHDLLPETKITMKVTGEGIEGYEDATFIKMMVMS